MSEKLNTKILDIYNSFKREMAKAGRKISFPKCKNVEKTYQYRWIKSFAAKCHELELSNFEIEILIKNMVNYAKSNNLLARGTQILCMGNILDICYSSLEQVSNDQQALILELEKCKSFIDYKLNDENDLVSKLLESESTWCPNIVYWYDLDYITATYIALSNSCNIALSKLPPKHRDNLPSGFELLKICTHTVSKETLPILSNIMGPDLRIPPTLKLSK